MSAQAPGINPKMSWTALLILATLAWALHVLSGCTTYKKCFDKYGSQTDTVYATRLLAIPFNQLVPVPASSVEASINLDSIAGFTADLIASVEKDRARLSWYRDQYNRLQMLADCLPDTIQVRDTVEVDVLVPVQAHHWQQPEMEKPRLSGLQRLYLGLGRLAFWLLVLLLAGLLIRAGVRNSWWGMLSKLRIK